MEKRNYEFKAFDSKGNEIKMKAAMVWFGITEEMANGVMQGIATGLLQKYVSPRVTCRELNEEETAAAEAEFKERFLKWE